MWSWISTLINLSRCSHTFSYRPFWTMLGLLNARPNEYRRVAYSEFENDHVHRMFRHFPQLQSSLQGVKTLQVGLGRNWVDQAEPNRHEKPREIKMKSTHRLEELSKSSLAEMRAPMDEMRRVLLKSRGHKHASSTGSLSSSASASLASSRGVHDSILLRSSMAALEERVEGAEEGKEEPQTPSTSAGQEPNEEEQNARALAIATAKLAKASLSFNPMGQVNVLRGFQGTALTMDEFDSMLRRGLNILLHRSELRALFSFMDDDGSGLIDGVEFTRHFLQLGVDERKRHNMEQLRLVWKVEAEEKAQQQREEQRLLAWQAEQVGSFTPADEASVYAKLHHVALHWDSTSDLNQLKLRGFAMMLSPFEFKTQVERSFGLRLTGAECGALLKRFIVAAREREHACVGGQDFLKFFVALRRDSRLAHRHTLDKLAARKQRVKSMGQAEVCNPNLGR